MNPTYAGRVELPENLKALFRTITMMVPDYVQVAQIYLYSVGYQNAEVLARKLVTSLKLCGEQLSVQNHYDFGMRSLKACLTRAGELIRLISLSEDLLILKVL